MYRKSFVRQPNDRVSETDTKIFQYVYIHSIFVFQGKTEK